MIAAAGSVHGSRLEVLLAGQRVGDLALSPRGEIWFAYDPSWIKSGFALSPMALFALRNGAFKASDNTFGGLHGVFDDALPDGWGRLLMDRALKKSLGWDVAQITPLDRLAYMGSRAMGALEFRPAMDASKVAMVSAFDGIAALAEQSLQVEEGAAAKVLGALYLHGGSPGGARPKVTVAIEPGSDRCVSGFGAIPDHFEHWIVKFRTRNTDPDCMGRLELAYARMAAAAGIVLPATRLIRAVVRGKKEDFFAIQRFDRVGGHKRHVISLGGMLEVSHRVPSMDYENLLKAVSFATRDARELLRAFRLMVFNVLAHNKDDHVRNFSFMGDARGWTFTPAYDLTFSTGMNGEHATAVAGEGQPSLAAIGKVAEALEIGGWREVVREVFEAVAAWEAFAAAQKVPRGISGACSRAMLAGPCFAELARAGAGRRARRGDA